MSDGLRFFQPEYRVVRDTFAGFEVQIRRWWWPIWCQAGFSNTHSTVEDAERFADAHANGFVKYLGRLRPTPTDTGGR